MDNYELAMMGVKIASEILHINAPEVRFFIDKNADERSINAVFNPELYVIAFNENWIDSVENNFEVMVTCFHESRHAYQYNVVNGLYYGQDIVNEDTIKQWKHEFESYHSGSGVPSKDSKYLVQDIEIDAIAFAPLTARAASSRQAIIACPFYWILQSAFMAKRYGIQQVSIEEMAMRLELLRRSLEKY